MKRNGRTTMKRIFEVKYRWRSPQYTFTLREKFFVSASGFAVAVRLACREVKRRRMPGDHSIRITKVVERGEHANG